MSRICLHYRCSNPRQAREMYLSKQGCKSHSACIQTLPTYQLGRLTGRLYKRQDRYLVTRLSSPVIDREICTRVDEVEAEPRNGKHKTRQGKPERAWLSQRTRSSVCTYIRHLCLLRRMYCAEIHTFVTARSLSPCDQYQITYLCAHKNVNKNKASGVP